MERVPHDGTILDFIARHIFLVQGAQQIYRARVLDEEVNLDTMAPLHLNESLQQTAGKFRKDIQEQNNKQLSASSIWLALGRTHWRQMLKTSIVFLLINAMRIIYGLTYMLIFDSYNHKSYQQTYWAAAALSLALIFNNLVVANGHELVGELAIKFKGTLFMGLYEHFLYLEPALIRPQISTKVTTVLNEFHNLLEDNGFYLFRTVSAPIALLGLGWLLVTRVGWTSLVGVFFCVLFEVIHYHLAAHNVYYLRQAANLKAARLHILSEIALSLKYIKMQMWESMFLRKAKDVRREETKAYISYGGGLALQLAMGQGITLISFLITLGVVTITEGVVSNSLILQTIFLIVLIRKVITYVTLGITVYFQFSVVLGSVAQLLNLRLEAPITNHPTETHEEKLSLKKFPYSNGEQPIIVMDSFACSYTSAHLMKDMTLKNMNVTINKGDFICLIGRVGAGKTTFLDVIAGQVPYSQGTMHINTTMAYVAEEPIIFSGSFRSNILLGRPMNQQLYQKVLTLCCLLDDVAELESGDQTFIEEKSRNISGGQRTRIALARALYTQERLLLLDGSLSAMDMSIASKINNSLHQLCREEGYTIIMTLHNLHFVKETDRIFRINHKFLVEVMKNDILHTLSKEEIQQSMHELVNIKKRSLTMSPHVGGFQSIPVDLMSESQQEDFQGPQLHLSTQEMEVQSFALQEVGFLRAFFNYMFLNKVNYWLFPITVLCYLLSEGLGVLSIYLLNQYHSIAMKHHENYYFFVHYGNIFFLIAIAIFMFHWLRNYFLCLCIQMNNKKLYSNAAEALMFASLSSLRDEHSGQAIETFLQDLGILDSSLMNVLSIELIMVFQCFTQMIMLYLLNPMLTFFGILMVICSLVTYEYCAPVILSQRRLSLTLKGAPIINKFAQMLKGIKAVKVYKQEDNLKNEMQRTIMNSMRSSISYHKTLIAFEFYTQLILLAIEIGMLFAMLRMTSYEDIGEFCSSMISLFSIFQFFDWILCNSIFISTNLTSVERITSFTSTKRENFENYRQSTGYHNLRSPSSSRDNVPKAIVIKHLSLRFSVGGQYVLKNTELQAKQGQKIAIIGRTGSGKSSFVQALYRLVEPQDGSIYRLFGKNACSMPLKQLRSHFACIPQFPFVFNHTIRKNVDPFQEYSDEEVKEALSQVNMLGKVNRSPKGIFSSIEHRQIQLSFGEKQLICIARVLIQLSPIIIMDEATSNIDQKTDQLIQSIIRKRLTGCTLITIAHKLANILDYDQILVFEHGEIIERGTSQELIKAKGVFYQMMTQVQELSKRLQHVLNSESSPTVRPL